MKCELRIFGTHTEKYGRSNSIVHACGIEDDEYSQGIAIIHEKVGCIRLPSNDIYDDYVVPSIVFDRTLLSIALSNIDRCNILVEELNEFLKVDERSNYIVVQLHY